MQVTDSFDEIQRNQASVRVNPNPEHINYMSMHTSTQKNGSADEKSCLVITSKWVFMLRPPGLMKTVD